MAVAPKTRAGLVSIKELPTLVNSAVKAANLRVKTPGSEGPLIIRWDLIGRILRDLDTAQPFAAAVVKELAGQGVKASPAVLLVDKKIYAGFFEKLNLPQQREFGG